MSKESAIKAGDVVCLKSVSPYMTVSAIKDKGATCWYVNPRYPAILEDSIHIHFLLLKKIEDVSQMAIDENCKMVLHAITLSETAPLSYPTQSEKRKQILIGQAVVWNCRLIGSQREELSVVSKIAATFVRFPKHLPVSILWRILQFF